MSDVSPEILYADPLVMTPAEKDAAISALQAVVVSLFDQQRREDAERVIFAMHFGLTQKESLCLMHLRRVALVSAFDLGALDSSVPDSPHVVECGRQMVIRLRKKLAAKGFADVIQTRFGEGYFIAPPDRARLSAVLPDFEMGGVS